MQNNLNELLTQIENKGNIVDIISDYISLEKKGNNFVGLCPFHSDSNPSMSVSTSKGIYKCFVCGAGGGPINFVQNYEGISFIEAVKKVSDKLEIDWRDFISTKTIKINPEISRGWEINQEAQNFFKYSLNNSNDNIQDYIKKRDLNEDVRNKFLIGLSGDGSSLNKFLLNKGFTETELIKYGLAKRRENTTLVDYFINRLMFAIQDTNSNIIGFSGRVIDSDSKYAKYLNSPETPLFKKSKILYNLNNAKIKANIKKELIVVEGFMDVIALYKAGVENAIATMGTAFTKQHTDIVKSITNNIVLAFDSDQAGINALISVAKELIKGKINTYTLQIPAGKDFDELYKNNKNSVIETIENKRDFLSFYKEMLFKVMENANSTKFSNLLKTLLETVSLFDDSFIIERTLNEISEKFNLSKKTLEDEFDKNKVIFKNEENIIDGDPYLKPYVPREPLRKEVKNLSISKKNNKLIKLIEQEELILTYAMQSNEAFNILLNISTAFPIYDEILFNAWEAFKLNKKNKINITNKIDLSIINKILNNDISNKLKDEYIDLENFEEYISNNISLYKKIQKEKLGVELLNAPTADEKLLLAEMLKNFDD